MTIILPNQCDPFYRRTLRKISVSIGVHLWTISLCFFALPSQTTAQIRPVYDQGALGLGRILKRLNTSASVMMIGAHPDDEDTALLSYLARGENARTAYLSLTRGDGGQNILGTELGEALGVIRTEELLQARKLDGAEQYFTRAYDYGFSKTLAEAKEKWDEKIVLCDAVRIIRQFRPLVVVSQYSGTPADGHGQHQYAGYISPLAVKAAADSNQCSNDGPTWTVQKFYYRHRGAGEPRLKINTGKYDPLLGRSYFEIAMEARSQHRSQEQGVLELRGDQFSGLNLVGGGATEASIFDGIEPAPPPSELRSAIDAAAKGLDLRFPEKSVPALAKAYELASRAQQRTDISAAAMMEFGYISGQLSEAILIASGIQIDALADRETVVLGETITVSAKAFVPDGTPIKVSELKLWVPEGWATKSIEVPKTNTPAFVTREVADSSAFYNVTLPSDWPLTQPYWLARPREGDLFRWDNEYRYNGAPLQPPDMLLLAMFQVDHLWLTVVRPVEYRYADDTRGEIRRNVDVVPGVSVEVDQSLLIVPFSTRPQKRQIALSITNQSNKPVSGVVSLNMDAAAEWKYSASSATFNLKKSGERTTIVFDVTIPAGTKAGSYRIGGNAMIGEALASSTMRTLAYPHIQTHRLYRRADTAVKVFDLKVTPSKIGYIAGSGDQMPEAIRQIGLGVELLDAKYLSSGDLSKFDVIVAGIRVSEVRPDFAANNQHLLDWVNDGGTLIVQYQRPIYAQQNLTPFPAQMGPRVSDENAKVTILQPAHPIFNFPNQITDADFEGWVQERNLYNFSTMDPKYTGLLESHDAGEAENKGGLVVADIGKGKYVYCSYSLFRQLPAGVPGSYRLLANMLSFRSVKGRKASD